MKLFGLFGAVVWLVFAIAASAQTPPSDATLVTNPTYKKMCAKCHGKTADGRHFGGPSLRSEKVAKTSDKQLHNIIYDGKHHMPKFADKLSAQEINSLVEQIRALNQK